MGGLCKGAYCGHGQAYPLAKTEDGYPNGHGNIYPPANKDPGAYIDAPTDQNSDPYLDPETHQNANADEYTNENTVAGIADTNTVNPSWTLLDRRANSCDISSYSL